MPDTYRETRKSRKLGKAPEVSLKDLKFLYFSEMEKVAAGKPGWTSIKRFEVE